MLSTNPLHSSAALAAAATLVVTVGCGGTSDGGSLNRAKQVAALCPNDGSQIAARLDSDESGTSRGETANPARQQVIREVTERTAICGGHLRVTVFDGSMIGVTVFDGDLHLNGATANARLRKAPKVVDAVMEQINTALPAATSQLSGGATDIVGQYQHGAEYGAQLAATGTFHLEQTILTDGIQTAEADLSDLAMTADQAQALAATFVVPDLRGATARLIGIGRQADDSPLPTPYIAALRAFHTAVCEKTSATCTVVTDAAGA
ncbi:Uncharacterised protein [Mycobacteroides abscessus subsp. massiliense]|uniref:hypothetical protein n=1 Tax=Mycobacteroides abscessus TaxID=36809 RepID=UPI0009D355FF|nr:hypothetical protein [Mycobacteroides abscessus]SKK24198.1 Uncharacterised protein [Mycobacteroides abscessus subsp. massiliense]